MIDTDTLTAIAARIGEDGVGEDRLPALRAEWPGLRFSACHEDDIPARLSPALTGPGFSLYLIGEGDHCLALTADPARAIGVVVTVSGED